MGVYIVIAGDTFVTIARKTYGDDTQAGLISGANPGVFDPLTPGTVLTIPPQADAPIDKPQGVPASSVNEVSVAIDGPRFRFWDSIKITRHIDSFDTVQLSAPFDPAIATFRATFRPFSYKPLNVFVGGVPLFTGELVTIDPSPAVDKFSLALGGYSLPGVLGDCTPPASTYPLEFRGLNIIQIAGVMVRPFGIPVLATSPPGTSFDFLACEPEQNILEFLIGVAKQRGLLISSTPLGELLFRKSTPSGTPVARLALGQSPLLAIEPEFNPQEYYSTVTGIDQAETDTVGGKFSVQNTLAPGLVRPHTFTVPDTDEGDLPTAVRAKIARMMASAVSYTLSVSTWRDQFGALWAPDTIVAVTAPGAMIYDEYNFLIRSVELTKNKDGETATLRVVFPGVFDGVLPSKLPWD